MLDEHQGPPEPLWADRNRLLEVGWGQGGSEAEFDFAEINPAKLTKMLLVRCSSFRIYSFPNKQLVPLLFSREEVADPPQLAKQVTPRIKSG
jgi:hypothetical protein